MSITHTKERKKRQLSEESYLLDKNKIGKLCKLTDFGDPYENRTRVTAVKGRCLDRLTNGPGSGNLIRTDDTPGMNRML